MMDKTKNIFLYFSAISVILMVSVILFGDKITLVTLTTISCLITLTLALLIEKYRTWFFICIWTFNFVLWLLMSINLQKVEIF